MNIVLFGPPGSGKGTQSEFIVDNYNLKHLAPGDLIRAEIKKGSKLGKQIKATVESGGLLPDKIVDKLVFLKIRNHKENNLFDGFPRDEFQAKFLDMVLELDLVIYIDVPDEKLFERVTKRWYCECGESYHETTKPPKKEGICDHCGKKLFKRKDDNPRALKKRLKAYHKQLSSLKKYYGIRMIKVNGDQKIDRVSHSIKIVLDNYIKLKKNDFSIGK